MQPQKPPASGIVTVLAIMIGVTHLGKIIKKILEPVSPDQPGRRNPPSF